MYESRLYYTIRLNFPNKNKIVFIQNPRIILDGKPDRKRNITFIYSIPTQKINKH